jgi:hypothetical protein
MLTITNISAGPPLGFEVRRDHCTQAETRTVSAGRAVASRRSVCLHQRQKTKESEGGLLRPLLGYEFE